MTKSNRHKKLRKQEKAKVQLTGVKKLSKAKNVLEPTLRVKKILIREQLKTGSLTEDQGLKQSSSSQSVISEEEQYTRRRQSVQDLLASANHHNINMRKDAVIGLQEIATSNFNTILRNLDRILAKTGSLASDPEGMIRKENLKLVENILSKISENQLRPFWTMLVAHLKCALTHLTPSVRYGVVPFIELLTDHHPALVSESSSILFPSILGLISTTQSSSEGPKIQSSKNKNATKLKVEIAGKDTDMTERLKVIRLLSKCLLIISESLNDKKSTLENKTSVEPTSYLGVRYPLGYCWDQEDETKIKETYQCETNSSKQSYSDRFYETISSNQSYSSRFYSRITADPFSSPFSSESTATTNIWTDFITSFISVLIETWVELGSSRTSSSSDKEKSGKVLGGQAAAAFAAAGIKRSSNEKSAFKDPEVALLLAKVVGGRTGAGGMAAGMRNNKKTRGSW